jgi:hypothetical protein
MFCRSRSFPARLLGDKSGATLVEFAVVAPVFLAFVMFLFDAGYLIYARSILSGEVNAAGRASTLETATLENQQALDAAVRAQVQRLVPNAEVSFNRLAFVNYTRAQARAEPFVDSDNDDVCDNGESFIDLNYNARHDLNGGRDGNGGARDVVIYTVTMTYDRLFPVEGILGFSPTVTLESTTLLRNQPFDAQTQPPTRTCV